jgi:hypothetical protein
MITYEWRPMIVTVKKPIASCATFRQRYSSGVSCRAKVLPSTQQLLTRHRIIGSQVRALPGTVPQLQRLTDKTCSNRNEVLATF